jgi:hypothetical protein
VAVGADQVAAIRPLIAELEDAASEGPGIEYCARFAVPGREAVWAEVVLRAVNFAYPFPDDPIARLGHSGLVAPPGLALQEWQPGLFATVSFGEGATSREVARFVDGILGVLLGCGEDYPVDAEIARL